MQDPSYQILSDGVNPSTTSTGDVEPEIKHAKQRVSQIQRGGIRPEFIIIGIICIVLPLSGYIFYRNVMFQIDEFWGSLNSHPCTYSYRNSISGEVSEWDLSPLSRTLNQCPSGTKCRDYSVAREDEVFFMNVCRNTMQKPQPCVELLGDSGVPPAVGYQTADGVCYRMGKMSASKWGLLDRKHPEMGLKLTYTKGSQCDGDTDRSIEYRFECDANAGVGRPLEVFGDCEFVVRWRTAFACPMQQSTLLWFLFWGPILVGLYLIAGFVYNVAVLKMLPDWEAVPHIELIRTTGTYFAALVCLLWERVVVLAPGLQVAWERLRARLPQWAANGPVSDTFFPVRSTRSW